MMTPEERKKYMHDYYLENKAHIQRYKRGWYQRNKDGYNSRRREKYYTDEEFQDAERERCRAYQRKRKEEREDGLA